MCGRRRTGTNDPGRAINARWPGGSKGRRRAPLAVDGLLGTRMLPQSDGREFLGERQINIADAPIRPVSLSRWNMSEGEE